MQLPDFYRPDRVGELDSPRLQEAVNAGYQYNLPEGADDEVRTLLLLVDAQVDFIHPEGSLHVPGAVEDTRRTVEWIYRNLGSVSAIAASLDSHIPLQIFYPTWWVDAEGKHPEPYTPITAEAVESGEWQPLYDVEWSIEYVGKLQRQAKKDLMIWPYHTMLGTPGHMMMPSLYEAVMAHSAARKSQPEFVVKGTIAKTEYYSLLEPEVKVPADPRGTLNNELLQNMLSYDRVYIAGQAKSHCVLETITSIFRYHGEDEEVIEKFHLMEDCTSSVQHPDIDFESMANELYRQYQEQGLKLVSSEDPIE